MNKLEKVVQSILMQNISSSLIENILSYDVNIDSNGIKVYDNNELVIRYICDEDGDVVLIADKVNSKITEYNYCIKNDKKVIRNAAFKTRKGLNVYEFIYDEDGNKTGIAFDGEMVMNYKHNNGVTEAVHKDGNIYCKYENGHKIAYDRNGNVIFEKKKFFNDKQQLVKFLTLQHMLQCRYNDTDRLSEIKINDILFTLNYNDDTANITILK